MSKFQSGHIFPSQNHELAWPQGWQQNTFQMWHGLCLTTCARQHPRNKSHGCSAIEQNIIGLSDTFTDRHNQGATVTNKDIYDVKENLLEINRFITRLDPSIRACAFQALAKYYFNDENQPGRHDVTSKMFIDRMATKKNALQNIKKNEEIILHEKKWNRLIG